MWFSREWEYLPAVGPDLGPQYWHAGRRRDAETDGPAPHCDDRDRHAVFRDDDFLANPATEN